MELTGNPLPVAVKKKRLRLKKTVSPAKFSIMTFKTLPFEGIYKEMFGEPEDNFSMIIYGESGSGKTEIEVIIAKEMTKYGKVYFNSNEQGVSKSLQDSFVRNNVHDISGMLQLVDKEDIESMIIRLKRKQSAKIVLIDSVQHSKLTYERWKEIRAMFPKKIFILISHSEGRRPAGAAAKAIEYDVDIKCHVKNFIIYTRSRFGGGKPYVIYPDGYKRRMAEKKDKKPNQIKLPTF